MYFFETKFALEKKGILTEIKTKKTKDKQNQRNILINPDPEGFDNFWKIVKYRVTLVNQIK